jgi:Fe-S-cluster containining protein
MEVLDLIGRRELSEEEIIQLFNRMFDRVWETMLPQQLDLEGLPARISSNAVTTTDIPVPDCGTCGACCTAFVRIPAEPESEVPDDACWTVEKEIGGEKITVDRFVRRDAETHRCSQLHGELGVEVSCGIYEDRPSSCRAFEAGSDRCHAIRRAYGIEPFLTIEEMTAANARLEERAGGGQPIIEKVDYRAAGLAGLVEIKAELSDGTETSLHEYDPKKETWFRSELEGHSVQEVGKMKVRKGVSGR